MATWDSTGEYTTAEGQGQENWSRSPVPGMSDLEYQRAMALNFQGYAGPTPQGYAGPSIFPTKAPQPQPSKRKEPSLAMKAVMEQFGGDMGAYNEWFNSKPPSLQKRIDSYPKALAQLKRERAGGPGGGGASWEEEELAGPPAELFGPAPVPAAQLRGGRSPRDIMDAQKAWVAAGRPARTPEQKLAFDEGKYVSPRRSAADTIKAYHDWEAGKMTPYATGGTIEGIPEELQRPGRSPERSSRQVMDAYKQWAAIEEGPEFTGMMGGIPQGTVEGVPEGLQRPGFSPERSSRQVMDAYKQWAAAEEGPAFTGMTGEIPQGTVEGVPEGLQRPGFSPERNPRQIMDAYAEWAGPKPYTEGRFEFPQAPPEPGLLPLGEQGAPEHWRAKARRERQAEEAASMAGAGMGPGAPIGQPSAHTGPTVGRFEFPQKTTMSFADDVVTASPTGPFGTPEGIQRPLSQMDSHGGLSWVDAPETWTAQEPGFDFSGVPAGIPPTQVGGARVAQGDVTNALMGGYPTPMNFRGMEAGTPPMSIGPDQINLPPVDLSGGVPRGGPYGQSGMLGDVQDPGLADVTSLRGPSLGDIHFPGEPRSISPDPNSLLWQQYNTARQGLQAEDLPQRRAAPKTLREINEGAVMESPLSSIPVDAGSDTWRQYYRSLTEPPVQQIQRPEGYEEFMTTAGGVSRSPHRVPGGPEAELQRRFGEGGGSTGAAQTLGHREMLRKRRANEKFSKISRGF